MECPNCRAEQPDGREECQGCGVIFARWQARREREAQAAQAAVPPAPGLERRKPGNDTPIEAWLLVLAFPILIPSLLINWLTAKRWGRIDFFLIAVDGFLLTMLCLRSPLLLLLMALAWVSSVFLWFLRKEKLDYGIFLGYSNSVATLLMAGGVLTAMGVWGFFPWGRWHEISNMLFSGTRETTVEKIVGMRARLRPPRKVVLRDAKLQWEDRAYRAEGASGVRFYPQDPRAPIEVKDAKEMWERREGLIGAMVRFTGPVQIVALYDRDNVEFSTAPQGGRVELAGQRKYALADPEGRLWFFYEDAGPQLEGLAQYTFTSQDFGKLWWSQFRRPIDHVGVALRPDLKPEVASLETWVPVADSDYGLWVVLPGDAAEAPAGSLRGVYVGSGWAGPELGAHVLGRWQKRALHDRYHAILARSGAEHARQERLFDRLLREIDWGKLVFLIPGLGLLVCAVLAAMKE